MKDLIPSFLLKHDSPDAFQLDGKMLRTPFLEKGIEHLAGIIKIAYAQWNAASEEGFFQKIDARIKLLFLFFFMIIISLKKDVESEIWIGLIVLLLMALSRLNLLHLYKRILSFGMVFGFLVALPSALNLFKEGEILLPFLSFSRSYQLWIYSIPETIGFTREGVYGLVMITLRVVNSLSLTFLLLYTTPFPEIIRALKLFRVPDTILIIITLSYKYLFLFSKTVEEMHLAKKSRLLKEPKTKEARIWLAGRMAFLFRKTRLRADEVLQAMVSRGFSDTIKVYQITTLQPRDWVAGFSFLFIGCLILWI